MYLVEEYGANRFLKRKDRPFFAKVARKYITGENTKKFFISNFIKNPRGWIGDFNEENYVQYKKRIQSLRYNYTNELSEIYAWNIDFFRLDKGDKLISPKSNYG